MTSPLDNTVWSSLTGHHAHLATIAGGAVRLPADVSVFAGLSDPTDESAWADLGKLAGADGVLVVGVPEIPAGWDVEVDVPGVQLVATRPIGAPEAEAVPLGPADVPEILDLVARTKPGPFGQRTIEMGTYVGIRRDGALIAMAGERLRVPGWTEISAVCTDPAFRGQGLASRLMRAIAAGIEVRGDIAFLHTGAHNTNAIRLYESMGFELRRTTSFRLVRQHGLQ
ncbi:MAG TPA: GNAT family N-acetyltransferase [Pseudonocardiaceae bacterium]|nr:GNAT family N-acetyltransferase [Pseudonocardiaceae bacterium]